jgi:hypothetical protein
LSKVIFFLRCELVRESSTGMSREAAGTRISEIKARVRPELPPEAWAQRYAQLATHAGCSGDAET